MSSLRIATQLQRKSFRPGEEVSGAIGWTLDKQPKSAEVRLFWYTAGKGTRDVGVVATQKLEAPQANDERSFSFRLPESPYSFSGTLISLIWAIELVVDPGGLSERLEITVSPTGEEIVLGKDALHRPANNAAA